MEGSRAILDVGNAVQASIILLANEGGGAVMGRTKMRMMVFLLLKKAGSIAGKGDSGANTHVHYNGKAVDRELRHLSEVGAIRYNHSLIEITDVGREVAIALGGSIDDHTLAILRNTKWFFNDMTDGEALAYVHAAYPDVSGELGTCKEIEQGMLEDILIGLIGKGKITSAHAARLLHRDRVDVMRMMSTAGIPVFQ